MSVNDWISLSDNVKAEFQLIELETELPTDGREKGNFFRIDAPGTTGNTSKYFLSFIYKQIILF